MKTEKQIIIEEYFEKNKITVSGLGVIRITERELQEVMEIYAQWKVKNFNPTAPFLQPDVSGITRLHLPEIKKKASEAVLLAEEYDFIIANLQHGAGLIGLTDKELKRHDRIIHWLKERKNEVTKASKTDR